LIQSNPNDESRIYMVPCMLSYVFVVSLVKGFLKCLITKIIKINIKIVLVPLVNRPISDVRRNTRNSRRAIAATVHRAKRIVTEWLISFGV